MIESAEEFVRLRCSDDPAEYGRATHDHAALSVWLDVIARFPDMRGWVAHNKTTPVEALTILAHDEDAAVRFSVALKRSLPLDLFESLSLDPDEGVRARIAFNRKAPADIIERLSRDPSQLVRQAVADRAASLDAVNGSKPA